MDFDNFLFAEQPNKVDKALRILVAELVQSKWQRFLVYLGLDPTEIPNYKDKADDNFVRAILVLDDWAKKFGDAATKEVLINSCEKWALVLKLCERIILTNGSDIVVLSSKMSLSSLDAFSHFFPSHLCCCRVVIY